MTHKCMTKPAFSTCSHMLSLNTPAVCPHVMYGNYISRSTSQVTYQVHKPSHMPGLHAEPHARSTSQATCQVHIPVPHASSTCQFHMPVPHASSTCQFHMPVPHARSTYQLLHTCPESACTKIFRIFPDSPR